MTIIPIILCGEAGSSLWPVSRELHPKPFICLNDGQSLLQKTFLCAASIPQVKEILTVTNQELLFKTADEYQAVNEKGLFSTYLLEPFSRNTAASIALAANQVIKHHSSDAVLLILPADHLIKKLDNFLNAVDYAVELAEQDKLVIFGIEPTAPATDYGYIQINKTLSVTPFSYLNQLSAYVIEEFIEKPSAQIAQTFLEAQCYLWNSGIICAKVKTIIRHLEAYCPDIHETAKLCIQEARIEEGIDTSHIQLTEALFAKCPANSFDYAVMEPAAKNTSSLVVIPCDFGWSDLGSWSALSELVHVDPQSNRIQGEAYLHHTENCYIQSTHRLVGTVGLKDLIIIDTADAVLIANKHKAQDVQQLYATLKAKQHKTYRLHQTAHRPWGTYTILDEGEHFKIKRLEIKPGASLSLQLHHHRSEHWIVVSGVARVVNGDKELIIKQNESTFIPAGCLHQLANSGEVPLVIIEVQSGEYLEEDDIVRFQDNYGRI